ncbi:asparagine--tRNA ligase [candidate division KSB1 bacterium]|nr:MAG: asparagine--tRNA ligase [candidate division KSB1 bacterium]
MEWVYIENISEYEGKEVEIKGWLYNKRSGGKLFFLLVRDGTGIIQAVVVKGEVDEKTFNLCEELTQESSLIVRGKINADRRAPGGFEIQVKEIELVHLAKDYPITPKPHGITFLLDLRHLWLRSRKQQAILRIRHEVIRALRDYYDERGFVLIDAPIFTPSACEGTTTLFETQYFGTSAYLTQSGQLYEEAGAMAFGKVYCFGPTFRAEKSKTRRHLTEFWMLEPEVAYYDLDDNMDLAEDCISYVVQRVLDRKKEELKIIERDTSKLEKVVKPFPKISYTEAVNILKKNGIEFEWGNDFGGKDETIISNQFEKPVFVHRFPAAIKAFYMKRDPLDEKLALGCDLLAPEGYGEIIGGGQREDSLEILEKRIKEHNLPREAFEWYFDLRKYGSVPHSGFGIGLERVVAWICGLSHLREAIPFPRTIYRLSP